MITENSFRTQPAEEAEPEKEIFKLFDHAETIRLSERDFALVEDLLENPPEPTPALLRAIRAKYGKYKDNGSTRVSGNHPIQRA